MIDWNQVRSIEPFFDDRFLLCVKHSGEKFKLNIPEPYDFHDEYDLIKAQVYSPVRAARVNLADISEQQKRKNAVSEYNRRMLIEICRIYSIEYSERIRVIIQDDDTKEIFTSYNSVCRRYGFKLAKPSESLKRYIDTYGKYRGVNLKILYVKRRILPKMEG